jgi:hypothetical protein
MATPSSIAVTEGTGKNIATYNVTETSSKELQRTVLNDSAGAEITTLPVSIASVPAHDVTNAGTFAVQASQSGTWTVQPGNTANTTAWKVDGSAVTQPVSYATTGSGTATGALRVELANNGTGVLGTVGTVTTVSTVTAVTSITNNVKAVGSTAAGASITTAPVTTGGQAKTANPTAVTDGQVVNATYDKLGKQVVVGSIRDMKGDATITLTTSTSETTLIAQVASTFLDVYGVIVENTSASASEITFRDTTGGSARFYIYVPAGETRGFMLNESAGFKQATVNTNWTAQSSASVTSIKIAVLYVKNT